MADVRAIEVQEFVTAEAPLGVDKHIEAHKAVKERANGSQNSASSVVGHTATRPGGVGATGPARAEGQHGAELRPVKETHGTAGGKVRGKGRRDLGLTPSSRYSNRKIGVPATLSF